MHGSNSLCLGQRPPIPRWKDDPQGCQEHLWAHPEAGGGVQAPHLRRDPGRGQPHPPLRPDCQQNRAGAEQNPLGASRHHLVTYKLLLKSCSLSKFEEGMSQVSTFKNFEWLFEKSCNLGLIVQLDERKKQQPQVGMSWSYIWSKIVNYLVVEEKTAAFLSDTLFVSCCTLLSIYEQCYTRSSHPCLKTIYVYSMLIINKSCTYTTYNRFIIRVL